MYGIAHAAPVNVVYFYFMYFIFLIDVVVVFFFTSDVIDVAIFVRKLSHFKRHIGMTLHKMLARFRKIKHL